MKIVQITPVVEYYEDGLGGMKPYEDATIYGLGDDGKVYWYGKVNGIFTWKEYGEA